MNARGSIQEESGNLDIAIVVRHDLSLLAE
jgi:hypothetical protein